MKHRLLVLIGPSGTGKTAVSNYLCDTHHLKAISSYTTRKKRTDDETGHIFCSMGEYYMLKDKVAEVYYNGNYYCTTKDDLLKSDIYVAEPSALSELQQIPELDCVVVWLLTSESKRLKRMISRGNSYNQAIERITNDVNVFSQYRDNIYNIEYVVNENETLKSVSEKVLGIFLKNYNPDLKYDLNVINEQIKRFSSLHLKPNEVDIYFDLDNTLCLFSIVGKSNEALENMYNEGYYSNLPIFSEATHVLKVLKMIGYNIYILSSCIDSEYCKKEKLEWIHKNLDMIEDDHIFLINPQEKKTDFIKNISRSILVDDYYKNINDFYKAGGIAIKKSFSGKKREILHVSNLTELFYILYKLNCS